MTLRFRHLKTHEDDYELIFGILIIPLSFLVALVTTRLPAGWAPYCIFRRVTDIPCPACGTFRSASLLSHGQLVNAWRTQPLMTVVFLLAALFMVYSCVVVPFRLPRLRIENIRKKTGWVLVTVLIALTALNWLYLFGQGR